MDQFETGKSGEFNMNRTEDPDHLELTRLLQEAKPLTEPPFPDQQRNGRPKAHSLKRFLRFS
jgi:hypothetical protein